MSDDTMTIGARVRVRIVKRERFASGAADALDTKTGTIEDINPTGQRLVAFDTPAATWWKWQSPASRFWFDVEELVTLVEG